METTKNPDKGSIMKEYLSIMPLFFKEQRLLNGIWKTFFTTKMEGISEKFYNIDYDDSHWEDTEVPRLLKASSNNYSVWYRVKFEAMHLEPNERLLLRFDGVFQDVDVWVNGTYVGGHSGYFAPFSFDITDLVFSDRENLIVVYIESKPEEDLLSKTQVMGIFSDWNFKPYPSSEMNKLTKYVWYVPMGFWAPVRLLKVGDVVPEWIHITTKEIEDNKAKIYFEINLLNLNKDVDRQTQINLKISGATFSVDKTVDLIKSALIPKGSSYKVILDIDIEDPRLWWPWTHGNQDLYKLELQLFTGEFQSGTMHDIFGIRKISVDLGPKRDSFIIKINNKQIFILGTNYVSNFFLDKVEKGLYETDLMILKAANINFIRTYGHIESKDFYDIADKDGFLVMCDFPLAFAYAKDIQGDELKDFKETTRQLAKEMVHLLYNHPSIVIFNMHTSPPWIEPVEHYHGFTPELQKSLLNKDIDLELSEVVRNMDGSKYIISASGDLDQHLYFGWYNGKIEDIRNAKPAFITEFGIPALPNYTSKFWRHVTTAPWPVDSNDESWRYAGYQPEIWDKNGIGAPKNYATLEEYVNESQRVQALYIHYVVSHLRRLKFKNCGGIIQFMAIDCHPSISFSIVDYYRNQKQGYYALRNAYNHLKIIAIPDGKYTVQKNMKICYKKGSTLKVKLYLVNEIPLYDGKDGIISLEVSHEEETILNKQYAVKIPLSEAPALEVDTVSVKLEDKEIEQLVIIARLIMEDKLMDRAKITIYLE